MTDPRHIEKFFECSHVCWKSADDFLDQNNPFQHQRSIRNFLTCAETCLETAKLMVGNASEEILLKQLRNCEFILGKILSEETIPNCIDQCRDCLRICARYFERSENKKGAILAP